MHEEHELIISMRMKKLNDDITEKWRETAAGYVVSNNLFNKPHLIEQIVKICDERASEEFQIYVNAMNKINGAFELDHIKEQAERTENKEAGVH